MVMKKLSLYGIIKKIVTVRLNGESVQALVYLMPVTQEEGDLFSGI